MAKKNKYDFEAADNPERAKQLYRDEEKRRRLEIQKLEQQAQRLQGAGRLVDAGELFGQVEQLKAEKLKFADSYKQFRGEFLLAEYGNKNSLLDDLKTKQDALDEEILQHFRNVFDCLDEYMELERQETALLSRLSATARRYGLEEIYSGRGLSTGWGAPIRSNNPREQVKMAFDAYARRIAQLMDVGGVPQSLQDFRSRAIVR